jgi:hypothetical protein
MRTAIYTCIFDDYNELQPHPEIPGVDWFCISDRVHPDRHDWFHIPDRVPSGVSPRLAAKYPKLFPWSWLPPGYDRSIWIDGTVRVTSDRFVADRAASMLSDIGLGMWRHPERQDIYTEAIVSMGFPKYVDQPLAAQVGHYIDEGMPTDFGLWACGVIVRDAASPFRPVVDDLMSKWLQEIDRWSIQDQLSFPYVLWKSGIGAPVALPHSIYDNPWLTVTGHNPDR